MSKRITLRERMNQLLVTGSVKQTFTLKDLRKKWKVAWHRESGTYRDFGELDNLFMHSFVHETVRPMQKSRLLSRLSNGVYQVTKIGQRSLNLQ